ncbi:MAG TPA: PASTA domain-containing protein [Rugosimonospora sp.]
MPRLVRRLSVLVASAALVVAGAAGCVGPGEQRDPPPPPSASPTPIRTAIPDVVGQNASTALDTLRRLGFTNIDLNTVDGHIVVLIPEHWTVQTQTPPAGQFRQHGSKIVLGCAKNP